MHDESKPPMTAEEMMNYVVRANEHEPWCEMVTDHLTAWRTALLANAAALLTLPRYHVIVREGLYVPWDRIIDCQTWATGYHDENKAQVIVDMRNREHYAKLLASTPLSTVVASEVQEDQEPENPEPKFAVGDQVFGPRRDRLMVVTRVEWTSDRYFCGLSDIVPGVPTYGWWTEGELQLHYRPAAEPDPRDAEIKQLCAEIERLRAEVARLNRNIGLAATELERANNALIGRGEEAKCVLGNHACHNRQ